MERLGIRPAGDVGEQGSQRRRWWRRDERLIQPLSSSETPGQQANCSTFDIALDAGNLAGEAQPWLCAQAQLGIEQARGIQEGISVQAAQPGKFGVFEVKLRKARVGRNPNRPEHDVPIPARAVVKFKAGKEMKAKVMNVFKTVADGASVTST